MDDGYNDELQQMEAELKTLQEQMKGMEDAEIDFTQAKGAISEYVQEKEPEDGLVSGGGSVWKEIASAIVTERVDSGNVVEENSCCVIA